MARVSEVKDGAAPLALIVDHSERPRRRWKELLKQRGYRSVEISDGDDAVDYFISESPDLVVLSLDIPSLDGHIAALEMKENNKNARIILTAPRRLRQLGEDATYSSGAVAFVEKPVTQTVLDEIWESVIGPIPSSPGLADLDQLYPDDDDALREKVASLQKSEARERSKKSEHLSAPGEISIVSKKDHHRTPTPPSSPQTGLKPFTHLLLILLSCGIFGILWPIFASGKLMEVANRGSGKAGAFILFLFTILPIISTILLHLFWPLILDKPVIMVLLMGFSGLMLLIHQAAIGAWIRGATLDQGHTPIGGQFETIIMMVPTYLLLFRFGSTSLYPMGQNSSTLYYATISLFCLSIIGWLFIQIRWRSCFNLWLKSI